jgi:uncharacterized protein YacL
MKLLRVFLIAFGALGLFALAWALLGVTDPVLAANMASGMVGVLSLALAVGAFGGEFLFRGLMRVVNKWDNIHSGEKVNVFIGVALGVLITVPFMVNFNQNAATYGTVISIGMMILMSAVAIFALRSMEDVLPWSKNFGKARRSGIKILDTNVIIDGRIYDVVRCGFLDGHLYLPKFVLNELQYIADQGDPLKRQRGRRGLEVLKQLQSKFELDVGSQDRQAAEGSDGVDGRLVRLARAIGGDLVTNDNNLNRVADLQDVKVLNINDLALAPDRAPRRTDGAHDFERGIAVWSGRGIFGRRHDGGCGRRPESPWAYDERDRDASSPNRARENDLRGASRFHGR